MPNDLLQFFEPTENQIENRQSQLLEIQEQEPPIRQARRRRDCRGHGGAHWYSADRLARTRVHRHSAWSFDIGDGIRLGKTVVAESPQNGGAAYGKKIRYRKIEVGFKPVWLTI